MQTLYQTQVRLIENSNALESTPNTQHSDVYISYMHNIVSFIICHAQGPELDNKV